MYNFNFNGFELPWPSRFPKYVSLCLPNSNVIILLLPCCEQVEKLILENSKLVFWHSKFTFSKLDGSTSSYHNSTNTGPIDMFFTKKCNYFSRGTRWNHPFLSQSQWKGCFGTLNLYFYQIDNGLFQTWLLIFIQIAKKPLLLGLR